MSQLLFFGGIQVYEGKYYHYVIQGVKLEALGGIIIHVI